MMKRWIALLLGIAMAVSLTVVPASAAGTYQDIPADSSLAGDIQKAAGRSGAVREEGCPAVYRRHGAQGLHHCGI